MRKPRLPEGIFEDPLAHQSPELLNVPPLVVRRIAALVGHRRVLAHRLTAVLAICTVATAYVTLMRLAEAL